MFQAINDPLWPENINEIREQNNVNLSHRPVLHSGQIQEKAADNKDSVGIKQIEVIISLRAGAQTREPYSIQGIWWKT